MKERIFLNQVAMARLFTSQTAMDTTIEAVQIHGGNGYVAEYLESMMRDAKSLKYMKGLQKYNA
jgi:alkylation response protein AidB-like acyl-CoA dehydrogenase